LYAKLQVSNTYLPNVFFAVQQVKTSAYMIEKNREKKHQVQYLKVKGERDDAKSKL